MRAGWPPTTGPAADYERLRAAVLGGAALAGPAAERFSRLGFAGLIVAPADVADGYVAAVLGAQRPRWCGRDDPREAALAAGFSLVVASAAGFPAQAAWA